MQSAEEEHQKKEDSKEEIGEYIQKRPQSKRKKQEASRTLIFGQEYAQQEEFGYLLEGDYLFQLSQA